MTDRHRASRESTKTSSTRKTTSLGTPSTSSGKTSVKTSKGKEEERRKRDNLTVASSNGSHKRASSRELQKKATDGQQKNKERTLENGRRSTESRTTLSKSNVPNTTTSSKQKDSNIKSKPSKIPEPISNGKFSKAVEQTKYDENIYEYEDDFEKDYESDFEEDIEEEEILAERQPKAAQSIPSPTTVIPTIDDRIGESVLLKRVATAHANRTAIVNHNSYTTGTTKHIREEGAHREPPPGRVMSAQRKFSFEPTNFPHQNFAPHDTEEEYRDTPRYLYSDTFIPSSSITEQQLTKMKTSPFYEYFQQLAGKEAQKLQAYTQTGEDNLPVACQTESPEVSTATTQHPAHFEFSVNSLEEDASKNLNDSLDKEFLNQYHFKSKEDQHRRLGDFVDIVGKLFANLLSTETSKEIVPIHMQHNSNIMLSSRYTTFSVENVIKECRTCCISRNPVKLHTMLFAIYLPHSNEQFLNKKSLLLEFELENPVNPMRIFRCENEVTSCCYSADGTTGILAGLKDGSCVLWDLREPDSRNSQRLVWSGSGGTGIVLRDPTYDTAAFVMLDTDSNQLQSESPVVSVLPLSSSSSSQQFSSVDEAGILTCWATLDNYGANRQFESDLGMAPDAKLKLTRISTARHLQRVVKSAKNTGFSQQRTVGCMESIPLDDFHVLLGISNGTVLKVKKAKGDNGGSTGNKAGPNVFYTDKELPSEVTAIRFSQFDVQIFAASTYASRTFLFHSAHSQALRMLSPADFHTPDVIACRGMPAVSMEWSPSVPNVLYTVYGGERLLVWDIENNGIKISDSLDFSGEYRTKIHSTTIWKDGPLADRNNAFMAFALTNGEVQVHCLERIIPRTAAGRRKNSVKSILFRRGSLTG
ncbi:WD repeat-containing protein 60 [Ditylenchus destructor]|uniref:WD repeat-containing protein 60 n=1 Tax=Ditylenchus destructor TaxID=166010 RepID=A0AAD4NM36_9BILA|nr:WD repeat-containing protein 60 [Ditylenchus destructor]